MASGYPLNEQRNFCYAPTYSIPNYVSMTNEIDGDDNEKKEEIQSLGQSDENNEHFNPSITAEQTEEKRRDGYSVRSSLSDDFQSKSLQNRIQDHDGKLEIRV